MNNTARVHGSTQLDTSYSDRRTTFRSHAQFQKGGGLIPGILAVLGLAFLAKKLGLWFPLVGGPLFGLILGLLTRGLFGLDPVLASGVSFTSKKVLQGSIVLLGGSLSLLQVWDVGSASFGIMITSLLAGFIIALGAAKWMKIPWRLASLIGAGTSICGASAIASVAPVIKAEKSEITYSISTIFLFNMIAVFTFPFLGHLIGLTDEQFGIWAGTAINDTSSVVAAGFAWNSEAGSYATVVKLARSTMIIPVVLGFVSFIGLYKRNSRKTEEELTTFQWKSIVPWFIIGFISMAMLNTIGIFGESSELFNSTAKFGITMALVAVGLGSDLSKIRETGFRPLLLGMLTWFGVSIVSILLILLY